MRYYLAGLIFYKEAQMNQQNKSTLTGGTLFIIAIIVLVISGSESKKLSEKIDKMNESLTSIEIEVREIKREIRLLREKNQANTQ